MKKSVTIFILVFIIATFGAAMYYLYSKNKEDPVVYDTEKPSVQNIVNKTVATGSILPLEEVLIKPNISGVIEEIYVEGGDLLEANDLIAKIKVIPNLASLNQAKNAIETAQIALNDEKRRYERQRGLFEKGVISKEEMESAEVSYKQSKQSFSAAKQNYDIVKTGSTK